MRTSLIPREGCMSGAFAVCSMHAMEIVRVLPIMLRVSPTPRSGFHAARTLCASAFLAMLLLPLAVQADSGQPVLSQVDPTEPQMFETEPGNGSGRVGLKRALVSGEQPSGKEARRKLTPEQRRALLQDLRDVTRDVNQKPKRPPAGNPRD